MSRQKRNSTETSISSSNVASEETAVASTSIKHALICHIDSDLSNKQVGASLMQSLVSYFYE